MQMLISDSPSVYSFCDSTVIRKYGIYEENHVPHKQFFLLTSNSKCNHLIIDFPLFLFLFLVVSF